MAEGSWLAVFKPLFEEQIPLHRELGLELIEAREGYVKFRLPFRPAFIGDFRVDRLHGGMMALVMDVAGGAAALTTLRKPEDSCATVDLRIDYLRPASNHDTIAEGEVIRNGAAIVVTEMRAFDAQEKSLLARGTGVFHARRN
jgi:uncharacterized protein (TIGR00369 family)